MLYGRARVLQSDQDSPYQPDYESPAGTGGYDTATNFSPTQAAPTLTAMPGGFQPAVTRAGAGFGARRAGISRPRGFGTMRPPATGGPNAPPTAPVYTPQNPGDYLTDELSRSRGIADASFADYQSGRAAWGQRVNDAGNFSPTETQGVAAPNLSQYGDELPSFDPGATYDKYLTAAQGKFKMNLSDALLEEQNRGAANGRLNTGWLDVEKGKVGERLATGFAADAGDRALAAASASGAYRLNTAQTRGDLAARGSALALQRAGTVDAMRQRAGEFAASQSGAMAQDAGDYATRTREYGSDVASGIMDREQARKNAERESKTNAWQTGINAAGTIGDIASRFYKSGAGKAAAGAAGTVGAGALGTAAAGAAAGVINYAEGKYIDDRWKPTSGVGQVAKSGVLGTVAPVYNTVKGVKKAASWVKKRLSDFRLKSDLTPIGKYGPLNLYRYRIGGRSEIGVLAHEARAVLPDAVALGHDGFYRVDYAMLVRAFGAR